MGRRLPPVQRVRGTRVSGLSAAREREQPWDEATGHNRVTFHVEHVQAAGRLDQRAVRHRRRRGWRHLRRRRLRRQGLVRAPGREGQREAKRVAEPIVGVVDHQGHGGAAKPWTRPLVREARRYAADKRHLISYREGALGEGERSGSAAAGLNLTTLSSDLTMVMHSPSTWPFWWVSSSPLPLHGRLNRSH